MDLKVDLKVYSAHCEIPVRWPGVAKAGRGHPDDGELLPAEALRLQLGIDKLLECPHALQHGVEHLLYPVRGGGTQGSVQ